jgi:uncharacterized Zn finger protein
MVKITATVTPEWIAANERAYQNRQAGRVVTLVAPGVYSAPSSKGVGAYTTTVTNVGMLQGTCDCPHGKSGGKGHCWHLAQALAAEVRRVSRKAAAPAVELEHTVGVAYNIHQPEPGSKMARFCRS